MTHSSIQLSAVALLLVSIVGRDAGANDGGKFTIATEGDSVTARACAEDGRAASI
jgi:hypothetical protein